MAGRITNALNSASSFLMNPGPGLRGVMPPVQGKDGTYGTQHRQSAELDRERRAKYPRD